jgi:hypothetical protein
MGAVIVGHVERTVNVEHGECKTRLLNLQGGAPRDISHAAQLDLSSRLVRCGVSHADSEGVD